MNQESSVPPPLPDAYLGDGVYASFDGYHIWLDLRGQDSSARIALDPEVLVSFKHYMERVDEYIRATSASQDTPKD